MSQDAELLHSLSDGELDALAESLLAPAAQFRLDELLARNAEKLLSNEEEAELNRFLERVDQLTVLKTRARYTLNRQRVGASKS